MPYIGEIAALLTSLCFSATSTLFTLAGRQVGSVVVNRVRLILAVAFLAVTFSLFAIQRTEEGVASTLMALPPVLLLPVSRVLFKERIGWQAVAGTLLAMAGVAILFLV